MALLASFTSKPRSRAEQALRNIKAIEQVLKETDNGDNPKEVIAAVVTKLEELFKEEVDAPKPKVKAKAKKEAE